MRLPPRSAPARARVLGFSALCCLGLGLATTSASAEVLVLADGQSDTYDLLNDVFTLELPDCGHDVPHITQEMDDELQRPVFVFHAHVDEDDDRCGASDRQRTEIRGGRLDEVVADQGDTVYYQWKFRLPEGFQTSSRFTHIFQIKSNAGAPLMTLTPRDTNFGIDGVVGRRGTTDLDAFLGVWVVVDLTIVYENSGSIDMLIRRVDNGEVLLDYTGDHDMWQENSGHDPKFGIYRSLDDRGDLRDEQVPFADFCFTKGAPEECAGITPPPSGAGGAGPSGGGPRGGSGGAAGSGENGGSSGSAGSSTAGTSSIGGTSGLSGAGAGVGGAGGAGIAGSAAVTAAPVSQPASCSMSAPNSPNGGMAVLGVLALAFRFWWRHPNERRSRATLRV